MFQPHSYSSIVKTLFGSVRNRKQLHSSHIHISWSVSDVRLAQVCFCSQGRDVYIWWWALTAHALSKLHFHVLRVFCGRVGRNWPFYILTVTDALSGGRQGGGMRQSDPVVKLSAAVERGFLKLASLKQFLTSLQACGARGTSTSHNVLKFYYKFYIFL